MTYTNYLLVQGLSEESLKTKQNGIPDCPLSHFSDSLEEICFSNISSTELNSLQFSSCYGTHS